VILLLPFCLGNEKPLERKIDTFLRNQETIQPLYDQHIGTKLDSDGLIERVETLKAKSNRWNEAGTRIGDFCDFIQQKILSDEQLHSPFTLDDASKPQHSSHLWLKVVKWGGS